MFRFADISNCTRLSDQNAMSLSSLSRLSSLTIFGTAITGTGLSNASYQRSLSWLKFSQPMGNGLTIPLTIEGAKVLSTFHKVTALMIKGEEKKQTLGKCNIVLIYFCFCFIFFSSGPISSEILRILFSSVPYKRAGLYGLKEEQGTRTHSQHSIS